MARSTPLVSPAAATAFEYLLANLGITQKNGHPNHPQTQGKIERFHQTLKRWLAAQPAAATPDDEPLRV
jgi:transposase InsO family protein